MDGNPSGGGGSPPVQQSKSGKTSKRASTSGGSIEAGDEEAEESSEESSSSLSTSPTLATSPISALENFRKEWEAELQKIKLPSSTNVNSALNLATASSASLNNPYPNPTSMAGAVSRTKSPLDIENTGASAAIHPFAFSGPGLVRKGSSDAPSLVSSELASPTTDVPASIPETGTIEEQARRWFLQGIGFERHGDLYDAVRCYRKAIQLVPDIEYKISAGLVAGKKSNAAKDSSDDESGDSEEETNSESISKRSRVRVRESDTAEESNEKDTEDDKDDILVRKFLKVIEKQGWEFFVKANKSDKTHISDLPVEIVSYMMRWLVSTDLDARSLDVLARVSKGFYVICRDDKLWQMMCERTWGTCQLGNTYPSYRDMYLNRPRVRFDGCYICRITYIRPGEHSFQDQSYRPWHFVEYYRYIRFFPDGEVLFLTSPDEPATVVPGLKEKQPKNPATLRGKYQLYGNNIVTAMVKNIPPPVSGFKSNRKQEVQQSTSFHIEFEICPVKGRNNGMLKWAHHAAFITKTIINPSSRSDLGRQNQNNASNVMSTAFELSPTKYPPMYFSRVKSYTSKSEHILE